MQLLSALALGAASAALAGFSLFLFWRLRWGPPAVGYIPVLAYHKVDTRFELGGTWVTPGQFARQMEWLKDNGYRTVTLSQAAGIMAGGKAERGKLVCLTFDDAYQGLFHYALPILRKHGFTATVFALSGYVGGENLWDINWGGRRFRHLDWEEMRRMQEAGIEFGSHGASHRDLRFLGEEDLRRELVDSKRAFEEGLGREVACFCYPFGRYDQRVRQAVIEAGYECACSHSPGMSNSRIDVFALRRSGVYITDTVWGFKNKVMIRSCWFWLQDLWSRTVNFCAGGTFILQRLSRRKRQAIFRTTSHS